MRPAQGQPVFLPQSFDTPGDEVAPRSDEIAEDFQNGSGWHLVIVVRVVVFKPDNGRFLFRADATFVKVLRLGARPVSCRLRPIGCQSLEIRTFHETPEKQDWVGRGCTRR